MKQENRTRKVTVRFTPNEYQNLDKRFQHTTCSQFSQYIRNVVLQKPVVIKYRNESLDAVMEELIGIRQELNAIGNNYNQAVKKMHILKQIPEFREWIHAHESLHHQLIEKTNRAEERIGKMSERWLSG